MKYDRIAETVFKRLLREGADTAGLGVYTWAADGARNGVIYDIEELKAAYRKYGGEMWNSIPEVDAIFRGMIRIRRPEAPCNGAWEVKFSATKNKGEGGLAYAVGYALAHPEMMLIPDRTFVSAAARRSWSSQFEKGRPSLKLDDLEDPRTPDPKDDCKVYKDEDAETIDRSYKTIGNEYGIYGAMSRAHHETMIRLGLEEKTNRKEVERKLTFFLKLGAMNLFSKRFGMGM